MSEEQPVEVIITTVNGGGWELLYVEGELRLEGEDISINDINNAVEENIHEIRKEWRIGEIESYNAPETYKKLCEVTET